MPLAAGKLDRRVRIDARSMTQDAKGGEVETWAELATVWASRNDEAGREFFANQADQAELTTEFQIRHRTDLDHTMRVVDVNTAEVWGIEAILQIGRKDGLGLMCKGQPS